MGNKKELSLEEVIQKALGYDKKDVEPLLEYLKIDKSELSLCNDSTKADAHKIACYFRKMGSNDIATLFRKGEGVSYPEIVYDVGCKLKVPGIKKGATATENESKIIEKIFADALDKMSDDERAQLLESMGLSSSDIPYTKAGIIIIQALLKEYGGFAVYKGAVIVANIIARSILGSGLSLATNAAITRVIGMALGPIGWIASGAWLAVDLAGPAFRKTVPAVIHIAMLRQMIQRRVVVGVVGEGSVGKDALLKAVFSIDTANVDAVSGSTVETEIYNWDPTGGNGPDPKDMIRIINFPGFHDRTSKVNDLIEDHINHADIFIMVVDINRGISDIEIKSLDDLKEKGRPILVCLNKIDLPRPDDKEKLLSAAKNRLSSDEIDMVETAFDPDPRLSDGIPIGAADVDSWVRTKLQEAGKEI